MWSLHFVPTAGCVPLFRARARARTTYAALSEYYYGNSNHTARISAAAGAPTWAIVSPNTWVTVCASLTGLTSPERQIAVAHQASAFTEWMARACPPAQSSVVADWINAVPFAKLLKYVTWPYRFSAIHRVERLQACILAKDFESLPVCFLERRVFRQLEYAMEQIVGARPGQLRAIRAFSLGDAIVVEGPRPSGRNGRLAMLIAHEAIHRIQCCYVGDTKRWLRSYVEECHKYGLNRRICGYRQNAYEREAYGVAMESRSVITETTWHSAWWMRPPMRRAHGTCRRSVRWRTG